MNLTVRLTASQIKKWNYSNILGHLRKKKWMLGYKILIAKPHP
jgi:hypothetical protein